MCLVLLLLYNFKKTHKTVYNPHQKSQLILDVPRVGYGELLVCKLGRWSGEIWNQPLDTERKERPKKEAHWSFIYGILPKEIPQYLILYLLSTFGEDL